MNSQKLTELVQKIRSIHDLSVHRAEGKYLNMVEAYKTSMTLAVNELTRLGDSHVGYTANTVEAEHLRVINEIIYNRTPSRWFNRHKFEESMSQLEKAVKDFIQESEECSCGQPVCPDCSTDIENCPCQDEVVMSKDGKVKAANEEPDMRTPTMLWMDITKASHKQVVSKDVKLNTGATDGSDVVNNPSHYQLFPGVEAIEVIAKSLTAEEFRGYCKGSILKYRLRAGKKDKAEQDLAKANKYIELYNDYKH